MVYYNFYMINNIVDYNHYYQEPKEKIYFIFNPFLYFIFFLVCQHLYYILELIIYIKVLDPYDPDYSIVYAKINKIIYGTIHITHVCFNISGNCLKDSQMNFFYRENLI